MIFEALIGILKSVPPWLAVLLIATLPVFELRASIPVAIFEYGFDPFTAFYISIIGNMIPVIPLLLYLEPVSNFLRRWKIWDKFFTWLFSRTYHKHNVRFEKYGSIGLAIFVGLPLPATGVWTGCAAAFVFGFKFKNAIMAIFAGVLIAGILVTTGIILGVRIFM
ncbi:MAG TPA: small multi-drug export protein [Candidatus Methanoperedens sp.]|nr:small multi-drug export protein [Candidatus Methanoperedens sp.]HLB69681.1 small multi-drug export protein [Candidatus Methanoperedens sp.]